MKFFEFDTIMKKLDNLTKKYTSGGIVSKDINEKCSDFSKMSGSTIIEDDKEPYVEKEKQIILHIHDIISLTIRVPEDYNGPYFSLYKPFLIWYYGRPESKSYLYKSDKGLKYTEIRRDKIDHISFEIKTVDKE